MVHPTEPGSQHGIDGPDDVIPELARFSICHRCLYCAFRGAMMMLCVNEDRIDSQYDHHLPEDTIGNACEYAYT